MKESSIQILENGIRLANKRGAYSLEEAAQLLVALGNVKKQLTPQPEEQVKPKKEK